MKKRLTICLIVFLAFFLRVWQIDQAPHGFNADEAAIAVTIAPASTVNFLYIWESPVFLVITNKVVQKLFLASN